MKVNVIETFLYEGKEYEKGSVVDLPESVARSVIGKGYGKRIEEEPPKIERPEEIAGEKAGEAEEKRGPEWKRKLWISEDRNLAISVWPPGGRFDSPSVTLEESRKDDSGNWETNRIYLPTGSTLVALSEHIRSAWNKVQKIKSEEKE